MQHSANPQRPAQKVPSTPAPNKIQAADKGPKFELCFQTALVGMKARTKAAARLFDQKR